MCSSVVDAMLKYFLNLKLFFVKPVVKCCVDTWLMTDLCVNVHKLEDFLNVYKQ